MEMIRSVHWDKKAKIPKRGTAKFNELEKIYDEIKNNIKGRSSAEVTKDFLATQITYYRYKENGVIQSFEEIKELIKLKLDKAIDEWVYDSWCQERNKRTANFKIEKRVPKKASSK